MRILGCLIALLATLPAWADKADVLDAVTHCSTARVCTFTVTVRHADAGWDHYANAWEVLAPNGRVIATRVLAHPHDHEQPFTRALDGVRIPDGIDTVRVRARDSVPGFGGAEVNVPLDALAR
ncbi:MAG: hypothetical protein KDE68_11185 [Rhodocyclaceae bacterium]|nr:hypothetical protein [Rhodocyclaceae bacterium]